MKTFATLALGGLALGMSGCIGMSNFGPESFAAGADLGDTVAKNGAPDSVMGNDSKLVASWRTVKTFTVLGLFATAEEFTSAVVVNADGSMDNSVANQANGSGMGILFGAATGAQGPVR